MATNQNNSSMEELFLIIGPDERLKFGLCKRR